MNKERRLSRREVRLLGRLDGYQGKPENRPMTPTIKKLLYPMEYERGYEEGIQARKTFQKGQS